MQSTQIPGEVQIAYEFERTATLLVFWPRYKNELLKCWAINEDIKAAPMYPGAYDEYAVLTTRDSLYWGPICKI